MSDELRQLISNLVLSVRESYFLEPDDEKAKLILDNALKDMFDKLREGINHDSED
jgi:hypothetical protein